MARFESSAVNDAIKFAKERGAKQVDLKFLDLPGTWQHLSIPAHRLDADLFDEGLGFDGSSIRGWQAINESDMSLIPDPASVRMDPFSSTPTVSFVCNIFDPITKQPYTRG